MVPTLKKSLSTNFSNKIKSPEEKLEPLTTNPEGNKLCETFQLDNKTDMDQLSEKAPEKKEVTEGTRVECNLCKRKFDQERIEKHEKACKNANKKRPIFNSSIKRVSFIKKKIRNFFLKKKIGEENQTCVVNVKKPKSLGKTTDQVKLTETTKENGQNSKEKWRIEHENFIKSIRRNKMLVKVEFFKPICFLMNFKLLIGRRKS